jgi:hypothetical protein
LSRQHRSRLLDSETVADCRARLFRQKDDATKGAVPP